jgi:nucleotide-binding universal stress UspA family protein
MSNETNRTALAEPLTNHVLVPLAHEEDARRTAASMEPYDFDRITMMHVVEKGEGVPDKTPVEQSEQIAAAAFAAFRDTFPDAESAVAYRRDVVDGIFEVAADRDVTAVVFRPREGGRISRFLSGDHSLRLVTEAEVPVVALPDIGSDADDASIDESGGDDP